MKKKLRYGIIILCLCCTMLSYAQIAGETILLRGFYNPLANVSDGWDGRVQKKKYALRDTLKTESYRIWSEKTDYEELYHKDGSATLVFHPMDENNGWLKNNYRFFPFVSWKQLDQHTRFEVQRVLRQNKEYPSQEESDSYYVFQRSDTLITFFMPAETGVIGSEGHTFGITGKGIRRIKARTKGVFSLSQGIDINGRDDWGVFIRDIETPWQSTTTSRSEYTLPIIDTLKIANTILNNIKEKALAVQKAYLIEKRDSLIESSYDGAYVREKLDALQTLLNNNATKGQTISSMYLFVRLDVLITEITVYRRNGQIDRFVHIADYIGSVP